MTSLTNAAAIGYACPVSGKIQRSGLASRTPRRTRPPFLYDLAAFLCPQHGEALSFGRVMQGVFGLAGPWAGTPTCIMRPFSVLASGKGDPPITQGDKP